MEISIAVDQRLADVKAMQAATPRPWSSNATSRTKIEHYQAFDAQAFLDSAGVARKVEEYGNKVAIFTQGDPATGVLYIQKGGVKLTVVNESGKEAVVAILGPGDFAGEGCLAGQPLRVNTATTITRSTILAIQKQEMIRVLHAERTLSERFIKHMLSRNIQVEEDLIDQLFNSSEKRLARTLLLLAHYGKQEKPEKMVPNVSQEMLAEMIGTTRSRVNFFMNKFRKRGFIEYGGKLRGLQIKKSLLSVILHGVTAR
ncbi:MAG: Crp/Fnr family transcriptional regulator [Candidatus Acidiferrales bacterium]|jgi:CRP-like cAMP-binding protein